MQKNINTPPLQTPAISVVVPMYNVEKYVNLAIKSLLYQTFKDVEFILVDDASTDKTLEIAKSFVDSRIKIIEGKNNVGLGFNRNRGLKVAQGEYIYFFDSDDALAPNALEILYKEAKKTNADMVSNMSYLIANDSEFQSLNNLQMSLAMWGHNNGSVSSDLKQRILQEYCNGGTSLVVWLNLYKRKLLTDNKITFTDDFHEDGIFLMKVLCATSNIAKIDEKFYIYRQREDSLSHIVPEKFEINFVKGIKTVLDVYDFCTESLSKFIARNSFADEQFIMNIFMAMIKRGIIGHMLPFMQTANDKAFNILKREINLRYTYNDKQKKLITNMIYSYITECALNSISLNENHQLKGMLKSIKDNINNFVQF